MGKKNEKGRLRNGLVDVTVLFGLDESTPIRPLTSSQVTPMCSPLEAQVLAVVSGKIAAITSMCESSSSANKATQVTSPNSLYYKLLPPVPPAKQLWYRPDEDSSAPERPEMPLSWDVIEPLQPFCFPDGAMIYDTKQPPSCQGLICTDHLGVRTYGSCLTFYRPFHIIQTDEISADDDNPLAANDLKYRLVKVTAGSLDVVYAPLCICLISQHAYHTVLKDCLSSLLPTLEGATSTAELHRQIMAFTAHAALIPAPPAGPLAVSFTSCGHRYILHPPVDYGRPVQDLRLDTPFMFFDSTTILKLVTALMCEEKIIFLTSSYSACMVVIECLLTYILPLVWRQPYVPVLPGRMIYVVDVPGIILVGCHAQHAQEIDKRDIVLANLDEGTVEVGKSVKLPSMPALAVKEFEENINPKMWPFDKNMERPSFIDLQAEKEARQMHHQNINKEISQGCLRMLAALFSNVQDHVASDTRRVTTFNRVKFIERQEECDQPFFEKVCNSSMFSLFEEERSAGKQDLFFNEAQRWKKWYRGQSSRQARKSQSMDSFDRDSPAQLKQKSASLHVQQSFTGKVTMTLDTPPFDPARHASSSQYYKDCLEEVKKKLTDQGQEMSLEWSLHFIRGMLLEACGEVFDALLSFDRVKENSLFPKELVPSLLSHLSDEERERLQETNVQVIRRIGFVMRRDRHSVSEADFSPSLSLNPGRMLKAFLGIDQFRDTVVQQGILRDANAVDRLFHVLVKKTGMGLSAKTIRDFYRSWKLVFQNTTLDQASEVAARMGSSTQPESPLYTSPSVARNNLGMGHLVLTTHRLLFRIGETEHNLAVFENLACVVRCKIRVGRFWLPVPALRFLSKGETSRESSFVCLKEDRDFWYDIIVEMHSGLQCSLDHNYVHFVRLAAENVLAYITLVKLGYTVKPPEVPPERTAQALLHFTNEQLPPLHQDVRQALIGRFNPSQMDAKPATIESLTYTPPVPGFTEDHGRIWCGLGSSVVKAVDAVTFEVDAIIQAGDRVTCLLVVGSRVWVGSFDKSIQVINAENGKVVSSLVGHQGMITSLTSDSSGRVWSAAVSNNGEVIGWDSKKLQKVHGISLSKVKTVNGLVVHKGYLWCGCGRDLHVINVATCKVEKVVPLNEHVRITCLAVCSSGKIWVGGSRVGAIFIIDPDTYKVERKCQLKDCSEVNCMLPVKDKMWAGGINGHVYIFDVNTFKVIKELPAHTDSVRSLCKMSDGLIASGPGSKEAVVAIWDPKLWGL